MKNFLVDMFIGWIIYTEEGKKFATKVGNKISSYAKDEIGKRFNIDIDDTDITDNNKNNKKISNNSDSSNIITNVCNYGEIKRKETND